MAGKDVAVKEETAVAVPSSFDYGDDSGGGFEGTTADDLSVPFIGILQSNSPQVEDDDPAGAKPGMLYNTVTRELYPGDTGMIFIPCHKQIAFVEWVPRDSGGGFVGLHEVNSAAVKDGIANNDGKRFGRLPFGDNELVETHYIYGLVLDEETEEPLGFGVISFTSTKIKPQKDWMTAIYTMKGKPPMWASRARIRTVKQKNEHGTFYNFRIEPQGGETWRHSLIDPAGELFAAAKEFREMAQSGMARAAYETQDATGDGAGNVTGDEAAPF
jgi:hypothetical protein